MGQIKNECFSCGQGNFTVVAVMSVVPGIIVLVNLVVGVQGTLERNVASLCSTTYTPLASCFGCAS